MTSEYHRDYYQKNRNHLLGKSKSRYSQMTPEQKEAVKEYQKEYYQRNKEKAKAYCKEYRQRPERKLKERENQLSQYGLTIEEYDNMLEEQEGVCKICKQDCKREYLSVDHCHDTGRVRGLLCAKCNSALGHFNDDIDLVRKALEYLA